MDKLKVAIKTLKTKIMPFRVYERLINVSFTMIVLFVLVRILTIFIHLSIKIIYFATKAFFIIW